jgi:hypothetical protein
LRAAANRKVSSADQACRKTILRESGSIEQDADVVLSAPAFNLSQINAASGTMRENMGMTQLNQTTAVPPPAVQSDDVKHIVGDIEEWKIIEILALKPTLTEVEEAAVWASGNGDVLAKAGHPQVGVIAQIVEILTADEEEPELP